MSIDIFSLGRPFYDSVTIQLPEVEDQLLILSPRAPDHIFVKSLKINGEVIQRPFIHHSQIAAGGIINFEMSNMPQSWASSTQVYFAYIIHIIA